MTTSAHTLKSKEKKILNEEKKSFFIVCIVGQHTYIDSENYIYKD